MQLLLVLGLVIAALAFPLEGYFTGSFRTPPDQSELPTEVQALEEQERLRATRATTRPLRTPETTAGAQAAGTPSAAPPSAVLEAARRAVEAAREAAQAVAEEVQAKASRRPQCRARSVKECERCCNDGWKTVPCFDVEACAKDAPGGGKYAFFLAQVGRPQWPWLTFLSRMRAQAQALAASEGASVDIVLLIGAADASRLDARHRLLLQTHNVRVAEVPWALPPGLRWHPDNWWPGKAQGWCGPQDLVRLHVLGFDEYDAVAFYDQDVELQGDVGPLFRCAAAGHFLSTSGGAGEPLNIGFFALRPDRRLLFAAELFADGVNFSTKTGWAGVGFEPCHDKFVGAECGQGFFHALFYKEWSHPVRRARLAAELPAAGTEGALRAAQIDRCLWNYQTGVDCPRHFNCSRVRAHHKPTGTPLGRDCSKLAMREQDSLAAVPTPPLVLPAGAESACKLELVHIGSNCLCQGFNYIKNVSVSGTVVRCEPLVCNPSGDSFGVTFRGSTITVTREDSDTCWCDGALSAMCCILAPEVHSALAALQGLGSTGALEPNFAAGTSRRVTTSTRVSTSTVIPSIRVLPSEVTLNKEMQLEERAKREAKVLQTAKRRPSCNPPPPRGCRHCCNDGYRNVPCLDVEACATRAPAGGKYAFVLAQVGLPSWPWLHFLSGMRQQADSLAKSTNGTVDILLMMLKVDAAHLSWQHQKRLKEHNVRIVEVAWTLPPGTRWWPKDWWIGKTSGWCGPQDLVRLNALGFEQYDAVAFYDQDVEFHGDVGPVLRCAATGYFLSTSGGVGEPLNVGFFAVRPDRRLVKAAEFFSSNANFSEQRGWAGAGFAPSSHYFVGAECGQGYFHTLLYKQLHPAVEGALTAAGVRIADGDGALHSAQIDQCIWNYQTSRDCPPAFLCSDIRAHHKPTGTPGGRDCPKLALRPQTLGVAAEPVAAPSLDSPELATACEKQLIHIGASCFCHSANAYKKTVTVSGTLLACEARACNPSGDSFAISFAGSNLTAMREDASSCWCNEQLDVVCCVAAAG